VPTVFAAIYLSFGPQLIYGGLHHEDSSWFRYAAVLVVFAWVCNMLIAARTMARN